MKIGGALVGVALLAASVACGGGPPPPGTAGAYLEGGTWVLRSIDELRLDDDSDPPWLRVDPAEGEVQGSTGCNTFSGPYRAGGTTVAFGPLATTRRACVGPDRDEVERRMLALLSAADGYRVTEGRLEIMVEGRIRMLFEAGTRR